VSTLCEKLGYSKYDRLLIVQADSLGVCHSMNEGIKATLEKGIVKTTSIMTPCPWLFEAQKVLQEWPNTGLGIHISLASEMNNFKWRPITAGSSLRDNFGFFWKNLVDVVNHATAEDVKIEAEAQILQALRFDFNITHIDSHMGVYFARKDFLESILDLSSKYKIPTLLIKWSDEFEAVVKNYNLPVEHIREVMIKADNSGAIMLDHFIPRIKGNSLQERHESYRDILKNLQAGVTQVNIHPSFYNEELIAMIDGSSENKDKRLSDLTFFTDDSTLKLIDDLNIKLISWSDLKKIF
jgi:predicted glycoside hydrolase/deacetylase ChbG (UPF0249 family)